MGDLRNILLFLGIALIVTSFVSGIVYLIAKIIIGVVKRIDDYLSRYDTKSNELFPINAGELNLKMLSLGFALSLFALMLLAIEELFFN